MNYYPFHIGDYASATRHLSWDEDMAYRRLMDAYYTREEPIPLDRRLAYRLVCATTPEQREAVDVVLQEFFLETAEGWMNSRCEAEIEAAASKRAKASQSAQARWKSSDAKQTQSERNANAQEMECERINNECEGNAPNPNPNPNPNPKGEPKPLSDYPLEFESAWSAYPQRPGSSKKAAFKAWSARVSAGVGSQVIFDGVVRYSAYCRAMKTEPQYIKQPATFFGPGDHFLCDWTIASGVGHGKNGSSRADGVSATIAELTGANRHTSPAIDGVATRVD